MRGKRRLDFSTLSKDYQNKWVALSADEKKVVGADSSLSRAIEKAKKSGEENPVLVKIPFSSVIYVL